jgi:hypothetical protein
MSPRLLRPRTGGFHIDAEDWKSRVIAQGGSVSGTTMKAVSTFCKAIADAGIRDRFYRLNLICGGTSDGLLIAPRVPLYRGPSRTGTQFGDAIDGNNAFVQADYAENNGLLGNGSTKYLSTGLEMTFLGSNQVHLFASFVPDAAQNFRVLLGARANLAGSLAMEQNFNGTTANRPRIAIFSAGISPPGNASPITGRTQYLCQLDGTNGLIGETFARNVSLGQNTFGAYSATNTTAFLIFAGNQTGTGIAGYFHSRIDSYSIGAAFTTSAGRTAYHDALTTFRAALGRT